MLALNVFALSFLDGFSFAGLFMPLNRPGAPTEVFAEDEDKLVRLKAAIAEGLASGVEDSSVVIDELEAYMDELVACKKGHPF